MGETAAQNVGADIIVSSFFGRSRPFGMDVRVMRTRLGLLLLCALTVCVGWAGVAGRQAATFRMPADLQAHVKSERFQSVTSVRGMPLGVRDAMRALWGTPVLDIVDPDGSQPSDGGPKQSSRRLVTAGCSSDHCLVFYELGGKARSWRVALFHWTPSATKFEWGGTAPRSLAKFDDVLSAALSGNIEGPTSSW